MVFMTISLSIPEKGLVEYSDELFGDDELSTTGPDRAYIKKIV